MSRTGVLRMKRLQLNADNTELLWFGSTSLLRRLSPNSKTITVGHNTIKPASCVRNLGVLFDSELSMRQHVSRVAQICFFHLRRLRSVRRQLGREVTVRLVSALVLSRLDYCNAAILTDLPMTTLAPLQRVLNTAARIVDMRPRDHVTLLSVNYTDCQSSHCPDQCKLCLLAHKLTVSQAPKYIANLLTPIAEISSRSALRESAHANFTVRRPILTRTHREMR